MDLGKKIITGLIIAGGGAAIAAINEAAGAIGEVKTGTWVVIGLTCAVAAAKEWREYKSRRTELAGPAPWAAIWPWLAAMVCVAIIALLLG